MCRVFDQLLVTSWLEFSCIAVEFSLYCRGVQLYCRVVQLYCRVVQLYCRCFLPCQSLSCILWYIKNGFKLTNDVTILHKGGFCVRGKLCAISTFV